MKSVGDRAKATEDGVGDGSPVPKFGRAMLVPTASFKNARCREGGPPPSAK